MKIHTLLDGKGQIHGIWVADSKNPKNILEAAFWGEPRQKYPRLRNGVGFELLSSLDVDEDVFASFWETVENNELILCDVETLKALWFDEFGSLKVNT